MASTGNGLVLKSATVSDCGRFRYQLGRRWGNGPPLVFVMLNPSTADTMKDDPTIRRCFTFAVAHRFEAFEVVNLFAYRATDPRVLHQAYYPVGPANDDHIAEVAKDAARVCVAWGAHAERPAVERRVQTVMPLLRSLGKNPACLQITRRGFPAHPLRLRSDCRLYPFTLEAIEASMNRGRGMS